MPTADLVVANTYMTGEIALRSGTPGSGQVPFTLVSSGKSTLALPIGVVPERVVTYLHLVDE